MSQLTSHRSTSKLWGRSPKHQPILSANIALPRITAHDQLCHRTPVFQHATHCLPRSTSACGCSGSSVPHELAAEAEDSLLSTTAYDSPEEGPATSCGCDLCSHGHSHTHAPNAAGDNHPGLRRSLFPRIWLAGAAVSAPVYSAGLAAQAAETAAGLADNGGGVTASTSGLEVTAAELAAAGVTSVVPAGYVPSPVEPGWEIWLGFVAGVVPFLIGSYEFGKRIIIQLRCEQCGGRGLVASAGPGKYLRKCPECGGFFPWVSWKMFLSSTAAPGNGGPLQQPRGQSSVFYSVPGQPDPAKQAEARARSQAAIDALQARDQVPGLQRGPGADGDDGAAPAAPAPSDCRTAEARAGSSAADAAE